MSKVYINGRSVVHKGDGQVNTCAVPDVCKTPSPGGPVPIPYVNVARDGDLAKGSRSVSIEGNPVALKDSHLSTSSGDEPGTAGGGLISSKTKGKMTWGSASIDVKIEGKGAIRFLDATQHNGNTFNTAFVQKGGTGLAYGDDPAEARVKCPICKKSKPEHRLLETQQAQGYSRALLREINLVAAETTLQTLKVKPISKSPTISGYMIGTLACKCGQRIYATMSGFDHLDGFTEAVSRLKRKDAKWTQCQPLSPGGAFTNPRGDQMLLSQLQNHGNPPGACAAPQLIQQALRDGHIPANMSELWYRPPLLKRLAQAKPTVQVTYLRNGREVATTFHHRESVPSCKTCQAALTLMLCDLNEKQCA